MSHTCHWPGCAVEVLPKLWGCQPHWYRLPKALRDKVWATYRPGQEITKTPSAEYVRVAQAVQQWCIEYDLKAVVPKCLERRDGRFWATEAGCKRLTEWLAERGLAAVVTVGGDGRYSFSFTGSGDSNG